jgi:hypothetical protein
MRSPWLLALMLAVVIGFAIAWAPAVAQGPVAVGDNCFAVATRFDRSIHNGSGKSLQQAEADALRHHDSGGVFLSKATDQFWSVKPIRF